MISNSKRFWLIPFLSLFLSLPAFAISLDAAKSQGLVGEGNRGYLVAIVKGNGDVDALVNDINSKREAVYLDNAKKAGVSLDVMEVRIGQRLNEKAAPGEYIQNSSGQWQKK